MIRFILEDNLAFIFNGSASLTTDATQFQSADRLVYDAFGNLVAKPANAPASPLKFAVKNGY